MVRVLGNAKITHIFSSGYKRTKATVQPLAQELKIDVELYDARALEPFAEVLKHTSGRVVVSGHSNTTPALVELLGGEPGVRPTAIRSVVSAWRELGVPAARAVYRNRPGHPVIVDRSHFPRLARASGDEGLGALLRAGELPLHAVRIDAPAPLDIDTPDDYAAARRRREP